MDTCNYLILSQLFGSFECIIVFGVISFFQRWWPLYNIQVHQLFLWLIISEDTWWLFCILSPKTLGRYSVYYLRRPLVVILYIISEDNWWLFCILSLKTLGGYSVYYLWRHLVVILFLVFRDNIQNNHQVSSEIIYRITTKCLQR
jgi:hypothetical protein